MLDSSVAIIPGSFDPVTRGHLDVIERAAPLFRRLVVAVGANPDKDTCFTVDERLELLRLELAELTNVEVVSYEGLTASFAAASGARWIVRGLRSAEDAGYELPMAYSNRLAAGEDVETIFLPTSNELSFISSRLVRQIASEGGVLGPFVSERVERALRERLG